jgi:hypothetical protein
LPNPGRTYREATVTIAQDPAADEVLQPGFAGHRRWFVRCVVVADHAAGDGCGLWADAY